MDAVFLGLCLVLWGVAAGLAMGCHALEGQK